jgi:hypothetical protein
MNNLHILTLNRQQLVNLHFSEESQGHSASKEYQLIFVSRRSAVCEQRLKVG